MTAVIGFSFRFCRQRLRDRGHHPGEEPAQRGKLPDPEPGRGGPLGSRSGHAPRGGVRGELKEEKVAQVSGIPSAVGKNAA